MSEEATREQLLKDFRERCLKIVNDLELVRQHIINRECPFLDMNLEKDMRFRAARRYYRNHIHNGLMDDLLRIIEEVGK